MSRLTSPTLLPFLTVEASTRYAIDTSRADWQDAELQVARNAGVRGKSDVVSIKSTGGVKRKAEGEDVVSDGPTPRTNKKTRRGKKAKQ